MLRLKEGVKRAGREEDVGRRDETLQLRHEFEKGRIHRVADYMWPASIVGPPHARRIVRKVRRDKARQNSPLRRLGDQPFDRRQDPPHPERRPRASITEQSLHANTQMGSVRSGGPLMLHARGHTIGSTWDPIACSQGTAFAFQCKVPPGGECE